GCWVLGPESGVRSLRMSRSWIIREALRAVAAALSRNSRTLALASALGASKPVGGADDGIDHGVVGAGVPRVGKDDELCAGPGSSELPGGDRRSGQIEPSLDEDARNARQLASIAENVIGFQPGAM